MKTRASAFIIALVTAANKGEAEKIAAALVERRLAACVNIVEGVQSLFRWKGKLDSAQEALLIIKSKKRLFAELEKTVRSLHSYEVPEVIALPLVAGSAAYVRWLDDNSGKSP